MGHCELRLAAVLTGLFCAWLDPVGHVFGERAWRAQEIRASCEEFAGRLPIEIKYGHTAHRSVAACVRELSGQVEPADQITWEQIRTWRELVFSVQGQPPSPRLEWHRQHSATTAQHAWHRLFRLSSFLTFGMVGEEHVIVWDRIATATLSCLLAMLVAAFTLRRLAAGDEPFVAV